MEGPGGFWAHSPGQIVAILKSQGMIRKKGGAGDLVRLFGGAKGARVNRHDNGG